MAKELVVYFSVYGTAKIVAKEIAKQTGADIAEIEPVIPYDSNRDHYNALARLAKKQHDEDQRPAALQTVANEFRILSPFGDSYIMTYGAPQAVHGAEIPLIFDNTAAENESMAEIMRGVWAQFARTGNPTIEGLPEWEPYTREGGAAMILDLESHIGYHHDEELLNLTKPGYEY